MKAMQAETEEPQEETEETKETEEPTDQDHENELIGQGLLARKLSMSHLKQELSSIPTTMRLWGIWEESGQDSELRRQLMLG